jgi:hypothetical protein
MRDETMNTLAETLDKAFWMLEEAGNEIREACLKASEAEKEVMRDGRAMEIARRLKALQEVLQEATTATDKVNQ